MRHCFALLLFVSVLAGCSSHKYFTRAVRADNALSEAELGQLQFYTDQVLVLRREQRHREHEVRGGLSVVSERQVDDVVIDAETPGVVVGTGTHWMAISFEPGAYVYFVDIPENGFYGIGVVGQRQLRYGDAWHAVLGNARLMFDADVLENVVHSRREVRGRTIPR